jgi:hypothetical protein
MAKMGISLSNVFMRKYEDNDKKKKKDKSHKKDKKFTKKKSYG